MSAPCWPASPGGLFEDAIDKALMLIKAYFDTRNAVTDYCELMTDNYL